MLKVVLWCIVFMSYKNENSSGMLVVVVIPIIALTLVLLPQKWRINRTRDGPELMVEGYDNCDDYLYSLPMGTEPISESEFYQSKCLRNNQA